MLGPVFHANESTLQVHAAVSCIIQVCGYKWDVIVVKLKWYSPFVRCYKCINVIQIGPFSLFVGSC